MDQPYPDGFRTATSRATATIALLWTGLVIEVISIGVTLATADTVQRMSEGVEPSLGDVTAGIALIAAALFQMLAYIGTVIAFCIWIHRAASNVASLDTAMLGETPGWAVGWWFIPFANLYKPYVVVRQLWLSSRVEPDGTYDPASVSTSLLPLWWTTWLIGNFAASLSSRFDGKDLAQAGIMIGVVGSAAHVIAAVLLMRIIRGIDRGQEDRARRLATERLPQPPELQPLIP